MATVRPVAARRLGTIIGVVLLAGTATAIVRASHDDDGTSESLRSGAPSTTVAITEPTAAAPTTPAPTTAPAPAATPSGQGTTPAPGAAPANGGLATSGPGAAATTTHPTTGGTPMLVPGLAIAGAGVLLRKKRSLFYR